LWQEAQVRFVMPRGTGQDIKILANKTLVKLAIQYFWALKKNATPPTKIQDYGTCTHYRTEN
jgi:hypothetical protein